LNVDGNSLPIKGGDTVCITSGNRSTLRLINFHGDSLNYIIFKNCGDNVIVETTNNVGISILNSSYFRFTGTGNTTSKYGIKVLKTPKESNGLSIDGLSTNYEIDHIEIANSGFAGIMSMSHPTCDGTANRGNFVQRNTSIHDNFVHNTSGEGFYIGHSFYTGYSTSCDGKPDTLFPSEIKGLRVFNNIVDSTGWDGIQVGCATSDCEIYGNLITNYGVASISSQNSGMQIGAGTTGRCYNNAIINGSGSGINIFGLGNNYFYNNIVVNAGKLVNPTGDIINKAYGMFCDDRSTIQGLSFNFMNNTIIAPKTDGIRIYSSQSRNNKFYNNLIIKPGSYGSYKNVLQSYIYYNSDVDVDVSNNYFSQNLTPFFVLDSLNSIYRLTETLPIHSLGKDVSKYGVFSDFFNSPFPVNGKCDIGAFQFNKASGNKAYSTSTFYLYPNPNYGEFYLVNNDALPLKSISIYTYTGIKVYERCFLENDPLIINVKDKLKKGLYIISIETVKNRNTYPLMILSGH